MTHQANHRRNFAIFRRTNKKTLNENKRQQKQNDPTRIIASTSNTNNDNKKRPKGVVPSHELCDLSCNTRPTLVPLQNGPHIQEVQVDHYENDIYKECLVCWDGIADADGPHDCLPCGHVFHRACINDWRYCNQSCPTCRIDLEFAEMHC